MNSGGMPSPAHRLICLFIYLFIHLCEILLVEAKKMDDFTLASQVRLKSYLSRKLCVKTILK